MKKMRQRLDGTGSNLLKNDPIFSIFARSSRHDMSVLIQPTAEKQASTPDTEKSPSRLLPAVRQWASSVTSLLS